jgi:outer membrane protein OmpA-like peptidoglycan-associated protein
MWTEEKQDGLRKPSLALVAATLLVLVLAAFATRLSAQTPTLPASKVTATYFSTGQAAKIKGLIISRNGDDMLIRDDAGATDVVTLTADTRISSPSGLFKMEKKGRDVSHLLPGLIVEVKGSGGDRGNLVADKISFHSSALRVAEQVAAGTVALSMRVDANTDSINALKSRTTDSLNAMKTRASDSLSEITTRARDSLAKINVRFDDIDRYDVRDSATVTFSTGSAALTNDDKAALDAIAASAVTQEGYLLEVTGYTDATGTEARNFQLSDHRARAVVDYLVRERSVPIRRVLNPTGFGEEKPVAGNDTAAGRAMNRRAVVKILINRGERK